MFKVHHIISHWFYLCVLKEIIYVQYVKIDNMRAQYMIVVFFVIFTIEYSISFAYVRTTKAIKTLINWQTQNHWH